MNDYGFRSEFARRCEYKRLSGDLEGLKNLIREDISRCVVTVLDELKYHINPVDLDEEELEFVMVSLEIVKDVLSYTGRLPTETETQILETQFNLSLGISFRTNSKLWGLDSVAKQAVAAAPTLTNQTATKEQLVFCQTLANSILEGTNKWISDHTK